MSRISGVRFSIAQNEHRSQLKIKGRNNLYFHVLNEYAIYENVFNLVVSWDQVCRKKLHKCIKNPKTR